MTMATGWYGITFEAAIENRIAFDIDSDALKAALVTNTYTPDFDVHDFFNDVTNEVTGTGYTAGGVAVVIVTSAHAAGVYTLDVNDYTWTTATFTARGDVLYDSTPGTAATNWLVMGRTYGADFTVTAGTFTTQQAVAGIWTAPTR